MSVVAVELAGSKSIKSASDGKRSASRKWFVYDDEGANLVIDDIVNATGMQTMGQVHPDLGGLFAANWDISVSEDRANAWAIVWGYSSDEPSSTGGGGGEEEEEVLPTGIQGYSTTVGVTIIDIWKSAPDMPASINSPSAAQDIGGTLVSEGGLPISMALPTADISIRVTSSGMFSGGQFVNRVGKRNATSWQGFSAGTILFTGVNISHTRDGVNEIEYSLSYDKWFHLRQVPERDTTGQPVIDTGASPELNVFFKQPFPDTTSFSFLPM